MQKIQLYNLINYGVSRKKIESIIKSWKSDIFSFPALENFLGEDIYNKLILNREIIQNKYHIHILYNLDIPEFLVEKFFQQYIYFNDLIRDIEDQKIDITDNIKVKIMDLSKTITYENIKSDNFIQASINSNEVSEKEAIANVIKDNICSNTREIINNLASRGVYLTTAKLSNILNILRNEGNLKYVDGRYTISSTAYIGNKKKIENEISIEEFNKNISEDKQLYFDYILSYDRKKILSKCGFEKESFEMGVKDYIKNLTFFQNEKRLYYFLSNYDIPHRVLENKYTLLLYNYVKFKYNVKPEKNFLDFLENEDEFNLIEANLLLTIKGKYSFDSKIKDISFANLLVDYYNKTNKEFIRKSDYEEFFYFCKKIIPNKLSFIPKSDESFLKNINSVNGFFKKNNGYFYYNSSSINDSVIKLVEEMISDIKYPHTYKTLFLLNKELLSENGIFNYLSLEAIIKTSNFEENVCFEDYCSPIYATVESFIVDVILEFDLKSETDLKLVLNNNYNFKDIFYDQGITAIISQFYENNKILEFSEINDDDFHKIKNYLKYGFCSISGLEFFYSKNDLKCKETDLIHPYNLTKLNLNKDGKFFFTKNFRSFDEAFTKHIENSNRIIYVSELLKLLGEDEYINIYEKYKEKKYFIRYTENTLFNLINPYNSLIQRKLYELRNKIVEEMDSSVIYNYEVLFDINKLNKMVDDIVHEFFDRKLCLISLLSTHKEVTIKETTRFLFRKNGKVSKEEAIKIIMNGKDYIYYSELVQSLESDFGYISTMDLDYLFKKLDLIYKKLFDMVFKNVDIYYKKVEEISNGY
jgi:hypothetical protein